jgi:hypothetical protein
MSPVRDGRRAASASLVGVKQCNHCDSPWQYVRISPPVSLRHCRSLHARPQKAA